MTKINELKNRRVFTVDGVEYAVKRPSMQESIKANEIRRKTFNEELSADTLLRDQLDEELRKRELWSDDREERYQTLRQKVIDAEYSLACGGIPLQKAKDIAIDMRRIRQEMVDMLSSRTELDSNTCEGKADAVKFNFLFANCLVYNKTDELYFKEGLNEYLLRQDEPIAVQGATEFFYLMSFVDDIDSKLPENKFLRKYKFANDDYNLVDSDGRLVDTEGHHINEDGQFIKWISDTEYINVDIEGRPLNKDGDFDVEHSPFLDDSGNPIDESIYSDTEEEEEVKAAPKAKAKGKKTSPAKELAAE